MVQRFVVQKGYQNCVKATLQTMFSKV